MTLLVDEDVTYVRNISNGWVYYSYYGESGGPYCWYDKLGRVRVDGTGNTMLTEGIICNINFIGDWIYYWRAKESLEFAEYDVSKDSLKVFDVIISN